jgi:hypothetical protein
LVPWCLGALVPWCTIRCCEQRVGWANDKEKKWSDQHRRSLVETKMRCFKLLGERIMARDFNCHVAELQVRAGLPNRFTQLCLHYGRYVITPSTGGHTDPLL